MIIDTHTHVFPDEVAKKAIPNLLMAAQGNLQAHTEGTAKSLLDSMKKAKIDYSVVLNIATNPDQGKAILNWIRKAGKNHSKLIFLGSVHPLDPHYKELLKEMKEMGIKGLKFHPQYQNFEVDSKDMYPIYEEALKLGFFFHFHAGFDIGFPRSDFASAERFSIFLRDFTQATVVLAHAGGYKDWHLAYQYLKDKSVYYDVAFALEHMTQQSDLNLVKLFQEKEDYFLFGTDSPWRGQREEVELVKSSNFFTPEQREKLFYKNALRLLGPLS